jgi:ABC-2 type transport system permease protein
MRKTLAIAKKEARQTLRDTRTLLMALLVPLLLLWLYGYALNFDIRHIPLAVQDRDHSVTSREITAAFLNSGYFELAGVITAERQIQQMLDSNRARAVLVIPENVDRDLRAGRDRSVQILINGDNSNTASTVVSYANQTVRGVSVQLRAERSGIAPQVPVAVEPRVWFNPELSSTIFLVPGLIAFIAMITAVVLTALSIVREKERGTMEQVRMAPVSTLAYVIGKSIPYFLLAFVSAVTILLVGMGMFGVPMRGSWTLLALTTAVFLLGALGQGLLISTIADSQQVAFQLAFLTSFLPTMLLSGFVFPIASMPLAVQVVTYIVPARYYLLALRGIVLKGVTLDIVAPQLAALAIFASVVLALASVRVARERG